jgi:hypothetical protein
MIVPSLRVDCGTGRWSFGALRARKKILAVWRGISGATTKARQRSQKPVSIAAWRSSVCVITSGLTQASTPHLGHPMGAPGRLVSMPKHARQIDKWARWRMPAAWPVDPSAQSARPLVGFDTGRGTRHSHQQREWQSRCPEHSDFARALCNVEKGILSFASSVRMGMAEGQTRKQTRTTGVKLS